MSRLESYRCVKSVEGAAFSIEVDVLDVHNHSIGIYGHDLLASVRMCLTSMGQVIGEGHFKELSQKHAQDSTHHREFRESLYNWSAKVEDPMPSGLYCC